MGDPSISPYRPLVLSGMRADGDMSATAPLGRTLHAKGDPCVES